MALGDIEFSNRAAREAGVASIPISAPYEGGSAPRDHLRLCFTKPDGQLDQAVQRLAMLRSKLA